MAATGAGMTFLRFKRFVVPLVAAFFALLSNADPAAAGERIAVILSYQEPPFIEALGGMQNVLRNQGVQADYEVYRFSGDAAAISQAVDKIKNSGVRVVLTFGSLATESAAKRITDVPIIACLVMRPESLGKWPNVTGVWLEFPFEVQFARLRTVLPHVRNIGVIYNPRENKQRIETAARIAEENGMTLVAREVRGPQDMPAALEALSREADVLLGVADSVALAPPMARPVLLFSFRNSIPFIGPSPTWVKAGALHSLDWDYADLGAQAGEMALKALAGTPPNEIPPAPPRTALYSLNLKTAQQMNITFPEQIVRGARQVY